MPVPSSVTRIESMPKLRVVTSIFFAPASVASSCRTAPAAEILTCEVHFCVATFFGSIFTVEETASVKMGVFSTRTSSIP
ncbi:hypothetical protein PFISCL1PPCAC_11873, partial [Pristionchus fissidentatus]